MTAISYSNIRSWTECPHKWKLSYVDKLQRISTPRALNVGSAVHVVMEQYLREISPETAIDEWVEEKIVDTTKAGIMNSETMVELEEIRDLSLAVGARAFEHLMQEWEVAISPDGERMIEVKLFHTTEDINFVGFIDAVLQHRDNKSIMVVDHKVQSTFAGDNYHEGDMQLPMYMHMLRHTHNMQTDGSAIFSIRPRLPQPPALLKNGTLSQSVTSKAIDWGTYKQAINDHGMIEDDYIHLKDKFNYKFFNLLKMYRSPEEVANIWRQVVMPTARAIWRILEPTEDISLDFLVRHLDVRRCGYCWFKDLCHEELRGGDTDWIRKSQYKRKGERVAYDINISADADYEGKDK